MSFTDQFIKILRGIAGEKEEPIPSRESFGLPPKPEVPDPSTPRERTEKGVFDEFYTQERTLEREQAVFDEKRHISTINESLRRYKYALDKSNDGKNVASFIRGLYEVTEPLKVETEMSPEEKQKQRVQEMDALEMFDPSPGGVFPTPGRPTGIGGPSEYEKRAQQAGLSRMLKKTMRSAGALPVMAGITEKLPLDPMSKAAIQGLEKYTRTEEAETPEEMVIDTITSFGGFMGGLPGGIGGFIGGAIGPIMNPWAIRAATSFLGKGEKAGKAGQTIGRLWTSLTAEQANLAAALAANSEEYSLKILGENAWEGYKMGSVFWGAKWLGPGKQAAGHAMMNKVAPTISMIGRQALTRALGHLTGTYDINTLQKVKEGRLDEIDGQELFNEMLFTWFSMHKHNKQAILGTLKKVNAEVLGLQSRGLRLQPWVPTGERALALLTEYAPPGRYSAEKVAGIDARFRGQEKGEVLWDKPQLTEGGERALGPVDVYNPKTFTYDRSLENYKMRARQIQAKELDATMIITPDGEVFPVAIFDKTIPPLELEQKMQRAREHQKGGVPPERQIERKAIEPKAELVEYEGRERRTAIREQAPEGDLKALKAEETRLLEDKANLESIISERLTMPATGERPGMPPIDAIRQRYAASVGDRLTEVQDQIRKLEKTPEIEYIEPEGAMAHAGEAVSPEAISRAKNYAFYKYDSAKNQVVPVIGQDAIDVKASPTEIKVQYNKNTGELTVVDRGESFTGGTRLEKIRSYIRTEELQKRAVAKKAEAGKAALEAQRPWKPPKAEKPKPKAKVEKKKIPSFVKLTEPTWLQDMLAGESKITVHEMPGGGFNVYSNTKAGRERIQQAREEGYLKKREPDGIDMITKKGLEIRNQVIANIEAAELGLEIHEYTPKKKFAKAPEVGSAGMMLSKVGESGWYTQGHYALKGKPPRATLLSSAEKGPDIERILPKPDQIGGEMDPIGWTGKGGEKRIFLKRNNKIVMIKADYFDYINSQFPGAKIFGRETSPETNPLIIKHKGELVGVLMPTVIGPSLPGGIARISSEVQRVKAETNRRSKAKVDPDNVHEFASGLNLRRGLRDFGEWLYDRYSVEEGKAPAMDPRKTVKIVAEASAKEEGQFRLGRKFIVNLGRNMGAPGKEIEQMGFEFLKHRAQSNQRDLYNATEAFHLVGRSMSINRILRFGKVRSNVAKRMWDLRQQKIEPGEGLSGTEEQIKAAVRLEKEAIKILDEIMDPIAKAAEKVGLLIQDPWGRKKPFTARENYMPREFVDFKGFLKNKKYRSIQKIFAEELAREAFPELFIKDKLLAIEKATSVMRQMRQDLSTRPFSHLERKRILSDTALEKMRKAWEKSNPGEPFPLEQKYNFDVLVRYITGSHERIAFVKAFGKEGYSKRLGGMIPKKLYESAKKFDVDANYRYVIKKFQQYLRENAADTFWNKVGRGVRTMQLTKLAFAFIPNSTQWFTNTIPMVSTKASLQVAWDLAKHSGLIGKKAAAEAREFWTRTGASTFKSAFTLAMMDNPAKANKFADIMLKVHLFSGSEYFNALFSGYAGRRHALEMGQKLYDSVKKSGPIGSLQRWRNPFYQNELKKMGLTMEDIKFVIEHGPWTDKAAQQYLDAAFHMRRTTQFMADMFHLPTTWSTPGGRVLTQFKNFSFNQSGLVIDNAAEAVTFVKSKGRQGDPLKLFKMGAALTLQSLLVRKIKKELYPSLGLHFYEEMLAGKTMPVKLLYYIVNTGGLGLLTDIYGAMSYGKIGGWASLIGGPTGSDVATILESTSTTFNELTTAFKYKSPEWIKMRSKRIATAWLKAAERISPDARVAVQAWFKSYKNIKTHSNWSKVVTDAYRNYRMLYKTKGPGPAEEFWSAFMQTQGKEYEDLLGRRPNKPTPKQIELWWSEQKLGVAELMEKRLPGSKVKSKKKEWYQYNYWK